MRFEAKFFLSRRYRRPLSQLLMLCESYLGGGSLKPLDEISAALNSVSLVCTKQRTRFCKLILLCPQKRGFAPYDEACEWVSGFLAASLWISHHLADSWPPIEVHWLSAAAYKDFHQTLTPHIILTRIYCSTFNKACGSVDTSNVQLRYSVNIVFTVDTNNVQCRIIHGWVPVANRPS